MKTGPKRSFNPDPVELERLYQKMSMRQIAEALGVGETVVFKRLKEYGISLKDHGNHRKKKGRTKTDEHIRNHAKSLTGSGAVAGSKNPRWKGGTTDENVRLRRSGAYRQWKIQSLALRGNKCQQCGVENGKTCECCGTKVVLHIHHVLSFWENVESRFDPKNSEVLCPKCHYSRHSRKSGETGKVQNG